MIKNSLFISCLFLFLSFLSCENNLEVVKSLGRPDSIPDMYGVNTEIIYSDSAKVKVRITAPKLEAFRKVKEPYLKFPKGIHVYFYNDSLKVNAEISSRYAIYNENKRLWEADNDVVVVNREGVRLNTEQLFWDENKQIILSDKYCKITRPDSLEQVGERGLRAKQDFSSWQLIGGSGMVPVKIKNDQP
jgi:LPS export ABC transporter protein LptC